MGVGCLCVCMCVRACVHACIVCVCVCVCVCACTLRIFSTHKILHFIIYLFFIAIIII